MEQIQWAHLNVLDMVILAIIGLSILVSFFRGFLREFVSLVVWVLAIILAVKFAVPISEHLKSHIAHDSLRYFVAFGAIFIVVLILGALLNGLLNAFVNHGVPIKFINRLLGVVFGAARGVVVVAMILLFIHLSALQQASWFQKSQLAPVFKPISLWIHHFLPEHIKEVSQWIHDTPQEIELT